MGAVDGGDCPSGVRLFQVVFWLRVFSALKQNPRPPRWVEPCRNQLPLHTGRLSDVYAVAGANLGQPYAAFCENIPEIAIFLKNRILKSSNGRTDNRLYHISMRKQHDPQDVVHR